MAKAKSAKKSRRVKNSKPSSSPSKALLVSTTPRSTKKSVPKKSKKSHKTNRQTSPRKKVKNVKPAPKFYVCHDCLIPYDPVKGHDCVPVTERQLISRFDEDLRDAFAMIRERVGEFGEQRVYNNARAVMFSRRVCYLFVRPKKSFLEVCFFLARKESSPQVHRAVAVSKTKFNHLVRVVHSDQIDDILLDWLREAYEHSS